MTEIPKFSYAHRSEDINKLQKETFDLLIIGGGITGVGIALDAASRGIKTALIEKNDFASGTSSKSTKLIHGGLRYLKQFDFWLVKETGSERAILHKLAPHLVVPKKMLLPIIKNGNYGSWLTSIGLKIYDYLADVEGEDKRRMLSKQETLDLEPLLDPKEVIGGGYYAEYRTDDARLTIEVAKTAHRYGATLINYIKATGFIFDNNEQINGCEVINTLDDKVFTIAAKQVINAGGPWVDQIRVLNQPIKGKRLHLTKGIHIVVAKEKAPFKQATYFDVPDGRMIFAIPRGNCTYIGTTDTNYFGNLDDVQIEEVDVIYLLSAVNHLFPSIQLNKEDILSSWAGVRPLIHEEGKSANELSRKDEIFISDNKLISIAGGKLTGYRKMAERAVDKVIDLNKHHDFTKNLKPVQTDQIPLVEDFFHTRDEVKVYEETLIDILNDQIIDEHHIKHLVHCYGKQVSEIIKISKHFSFENDELNLLIAELHFCFQHEQIFMIEDFVSRRTGYLLFYKQIIKKYAQELINELSVLCKWDKTEKENQYKILIEKIENNAFLK